MLSNNLLLLLVLLSKKPELEARRPRQHQQKHHHHHLRIINGRSIPIEEAPWQISMQFNGKHFCGGSILSSKIIVTAAHCVHPYKPSEVSVRAGSQYRKSGGILIPVASFIVHPRFETENYSNDIALLRLKRALSFNAKARRIQLALDVPTNGSRVSVSGWGDIGMGQDKMPNNLQKVHLHALDRKSCQNSKYMQIHKKILKGMICAVRHERDACQGDSGGPLVANGQLAGIVSWGLGCAEDGFPGVYTSVPYYRNWLEREIKKR